MQKEERGEKKEKGWEKPTFLKEWSRSKAFYSQRRLSRGNHCLTSQNTESLFRPTSSGVPYRRGRTMRSAEVDPWMECKNGDLYANRRTALCRPGPSPGPQSQPKHVFHSESLHPQVVGHKLFDNNMAQLTEPDLQDRVFVGGQQNFVMCLERGN